MRNSRRALRVFPAHAGVIPVQLSSGNVDQSFPRTRGGDPYCIVALTFIIAFSPHTRG